MGAYINKYLLQSNSVNTVIRDNGNYYTNGLPNAAQWTTWWGTTNPVLGP